MVAALPARPCSPASRSRTWKAPLGVPCVRHGRQLPQGLRGDALRYLASAPAAPWHCNSGAFRTGWASALLLTALGVPRAQVDSDFLLSNVTYEGKYAFVEYLDAAFAQAQADFGSFEGFLDKGLGVDDTDTGVLRKSLLPEPEVTTPRRASSLPGLGIRGCGR